MPDTDGFGVANRTSAPVFWRRLEPETKVVTMKRGVVRSVVCFSSTYGRVVCISAGSLVDETRVVDGGTVVVVLVVTLGVVVVLVVTLGVVFPRKV